MAFRWTCPYCNHDTTIIESNFKGGSVGLGYESKLGVVNTHVKYIVCPNPDCLKVALYVELFRANTDASGKFFHSKEQIKSWRLLPESEAKVFPDYIPKPIIDDYVEACQIKELSPKASATLSRRCLQGMIRDFWDVKENRLVDEIEAIKDKVDPLTWESIDAVRKVGNIGAHMEQDINLIIDVDADESSLLIELIETLVRDWYITRYERQQRMINIIKIKDDKENDKKGKS